MKLVDFIPEFAAALKAQLERDEIRWGNTWITRGREGQEERFISWVEDKITDYDNGEPFPWLKLGGEALINWVRENHPEVLS